MPFPPLSCPAPTALAAAQAAQSRFAADAPGVAPGFPGPQAQWWARAARPPTPALRQELPVGRSVPLSPPGRPAPTAVAVAQAAWSCLAFGALGLAPASPALQDTPARPVGPAATEQDSPVPLSARAQAGQARPRQVEPTAHDGGRHIPAAAMWRPPGHRASVAHLAGLLPATRRRAFGRLKGCASEAAWRLVGLRAVAALSAFPHRLAGLGEKARVVDG